MCLHGNTTYVCSITFGAADRSGISHLTGISIEGHRSMLSFGPSGRITYEECLINAYRLKMVPIFSRRPLATVLIELNANEASAAANVRFGSSQD